MTMIGPFITPVARLRSWSETGSGPACPKAGGRLPKPLPPCPGRSPRHGQSHHDRLHVIAIMLKTWIRRLWPASNQQAATPKSP